MRTQRARWPGLRDVFHDHILRLVQPATYVFHRIFRGADREREQPLAITLQLDHLIANGSLPDAEQLHEQLQLLHKFRIPCDRHAVAGAGGLNIPAEAPRDLV